MSGVQSVRADHVKPGHQVYNSKAFHPSAAWSTVTRVEECRGYIVISTHGYDTWKHPAEAVAVR